MRYLLISEKPSLMRLVQSAYLKAKPGIDVDFIALHGHCCTLYSPNDYDSKYSKWNKNDLPIIPEVYKHKPVEPELVKEIAKKLNSTPYDGLINCTDAEREGQNIFYSLYDYLNCRLPVKRFWASDLTEEKLVESWKNLRDDQNEPFLKNLTEASLLRANLDWLIGMNFSRAITISTGQNIPIGRVMSVVLSILAKREEDIKNFKPSKSYKLIVDYTQGFSGEYKHDPYLNKEDCDNKAAEVSKELKVKQVKKNIKTSEAPLLYSLGDLQNDANKEFGYTLNQSLGIIQGLYEAKILSYPRTDCPYLTTGEAKRIKDILKVCKSIPDLEDVKVDEEKVKNYVSSKYVNDKKVQAHYAIIFTGSNFDWNKLKKEERNILTLVAKRILSTVLPEAKTNEIEIIAEDGNDEFVSKEKVLIKAGWKTLYKEEEGNVLLDGIKEGQKLNLKNSYSKEVVTTCPSRFNDASINKAMINVGSLIEDKDLASALQGKTKDQGGIGTPATRAGIIEKLLDPKKNWVIRKNKNFVVNQEGLDVYHKIKNYSFSSPILTAEWESKLKQVEEGHINSTSLLGEANEFVKKECEELLNIKPDSSLNCPLCDGYIKESKDYYYCSNYKPCTFIVKKVTFGAPITKEDIHKIIKEGQTNFKKMKSKEGKSFEGALKLNKDKFELIFNNDHKTEDIICECGKQVSKHDGKFGVYYKCECGSIVSEKYLGHKFSKKEIKELFSGKTVTCKDLVSKNGKSFSANLKIKEHKLAIESFVNKEN